MYVSDVLADLLQGASRYRELVRRHCLPLVDRLPPHLVRAIRPSAEYISGKCMGYPPVWFVGRALELEGDAVDALLGSSHTSLCLSLSTSIADDLLDGEEGVGGPHLMFFYLLLFEALAQQDWRRGGQGDFIHAHAVAAMDFFVLPGVAEQLRRGCDIATLEDLQRRGGSRIGNFHRMIAHSLLAALPSRRRNAEALVDLAGRFGHWCSDLDDVLDVERDVLDGNPSALAAMELLRLEPEARAALLRRDLDALAPLLEDARFVRALGRHLAGSIRETAEGVRDWGAASLARDLDELAARLPDRVVDYRRNVRREHIREAASA